MLTVKIESILKVCLRSGTLLSFILIVAGAASTLYQFGGEQINPQLIPSPLYQMNARKLWQLIFTSPSVGMIELGILILILIQIINVGILFVYYSFRKDIWFTGISFLIFTLLVMSFIKQFF